MRPRLAIVPGDPSGIGPELIARLLAEDGVREAADILLVGDAHLWRRGADQAGLEIPLDTIDPRDSGSFTGLAHLDLDTIAPEDVQIGRAHV